MPAQAPSSRSERLILTGGWMVAISLVLIAVYLGWRVQSTKAAPVDATLANHEVSAQPATVQEGDNSSAALPVFSVITTTQALSPRADFHTIIPTRPRTEAIDYTVDTGDAIFSIAQNFRLKPETILWANYDLLNDNPDMLSPGMTLHVPPVDGVYYQWKEGDTLEAIAGQFKASINDILEWAGNKLDLTDPTIDAGQWIMIPGGEREYRSWIIPTIARGKAGVSKSVYGPGACEGSYDGAYGSGAFSWPSSNHFLSGNDYWSGHLGIDLAGATGDGVFAADSGVVVFSGWATGGYGYMIMIDHGNGYQTVYAHLSAVSVNCGQSVYQGGYIGALGSTGNSTGSHLHFEVRYGGGFISPWIVLPAP